MGDTRQRIIDSLFSGPNPEGSYEAHVKIWENDDGGGRKPRYIILAYHRPSGRGKIFKTKLNSTGSFSVGKTWELDSLRGLTAVNATRFDIQMSRVYRWDTENATDQATFLYAAVRLFRETNPGIPIATTGFNPDIPPASSSYAAYSDDGAMRQGNPPPSAARRIGGHNRTPSTSSTFSGGSPQQLSVPAPRRPMGMSSAMGPVPPSPTTVYAPSQGRRSPSPPPRQMTPSRQRQRPTAIAVDDMPAMPPLSPTRSSTTTMTSGRRSPPNGIGGYSSRTSMSDQVPRAITPSSSVGRERLGARTPISRNPSAVAGSPVANGPPPSGRPIVATNGLNSARSGRQSEDSQRSVVNTTPTRVAGTRLRSPSPPTAGTPRINGRSVSPLPPSRVVERERDRPPSPNFSRRNGRTTSPEPAPKPDPPLAARRNLPRDTTANSSPATSTRSLPQAQQSKNAAAAPPQEQTSFFEDEDLEATLANVEEILEGYEWASGFDAVSRKHVKGTADQIEARLITELSALEKANTHSFIESDDRIAQLIGFIDSAVTRLDEMDTLISSYKIHLNVVNDDISHIQSQSRGLQVQTQNQRALLAELEQLVQTVNVDRGALTTLTQERMDSQQGITQLEKAAAELYKALLASTDREMAASMERLSEYRTINVQFCKRLFDFLQMMFPLQTDAILNSRTSRSRDILTIADHRAMEDALGRYSGLILYLKEMDEDRFSKLCAVYFSTASDLHSKQFRSLMSAYMEMVKKAAEDDIENIFGNTPTTATKSTTALGRAGTVLRPYKKDKPVEEDGGDTPAHEALARILEQIGPQIFKEEEFMADFLQINDADLTFADYMNLETYFRRQAARTSGLSAATTKLVKSALDLIFGFLPLELKQWVEAALQMDNFQIVGIIAAVEKFIADADERASQFFMRMLEKQLVRLRVVFERHVDDQIKNVEKVKVSAKKRKGVAPFIKWFPAYVMRIENQLIGINVLEIRGNVDAAFERIVDAMFDALQQMAKIEGEGDDKDKGQLNYHVILIENMYHFVNELKQVSLGAVGGFSKRAKALYDENMSAYVKIVLRRPFSKILDYFDGVERLMQTTAPSQISNNSNYNKSALRKVLKEYDGKDVKRLVDALYKRVEKHFAENSSTGDASSNSTLNAVWKACEEETVASTERFSKLISQCYSGGGLSLEYTMMDVRAAYKRKA